MRGFALTAVLLCLAASPAWCDGPVSTAPATAPAMPPQAVAPPIGADVGGDSDTIVRTNACGGPRAPAGDASAPADTAAHGEVDVAAGTDGYRSVHGYACKPLGDNGWVGVSVGESSGQWSRRR